MGNEGNSLVRGTGKQPTRNEPREEARAEKEEVKENPVWIDRQRIRRIYESLMVYERTHSDFLLRWAQDELMHIVRDS